MISSVGSKMAITLKELYRKHEQFDLLMEAVANDDKGKLFEVLHAMHMHPERTFPTHYRDEITQKSPEETHNAIKKRITPAEYNTINDHARSSAERMKAHLTEQGHNPAHITHVAWTSNGAGDVAKFTGKNDPHNDSDVMYRFKHPKTGKTTHVGVGLKYGSQREPNIRNPGLESLENMTGAKTLVSRFEKHKKKIASLGYRESSAEKNHEVWKKEKNSVRGKAADASKLETTRRMAGDIHKALSEKTSEELGHYVRNVVAARTAHPVYRMHAHTSHNEAGSSVTHYVDEPSKDIDTHLSQFSELFVDKKHSGGISVYIRGRRKSDGKIVNVLQHAVKGVSGPMKGIAATTKLPGYRPGGSKSTANKKSGAKKLKEEISKASIAAQIFEAQQKSQSISRAIEKNQEIYRKMAASDANNRAIERNIEMNSAEIASKAIRRSAETPDNIDTRWVDNSGQVRGLQGGARVAGMMTRQANLGNKDMLGDTGAGLNDVDMALLQKAAMRINQKMKGENQNDETEEEVNEEAPANSMGAAGISGLSSAVDVGIAGRDMLLAPGPLRRPPPKMFGGKRVFTVPSSDYYKATLGRKKGQHWRSMVAGPLGEEIRQYALDNKDAPIIVEDETTGAMMYLRYGKR